MSKTVLWYVCHVIENSTLKSNVHGMKLSNCPHLVFDDNSDSATNPFKYNTIGRSNPFSSSDGANGATANGNASTNPFLTDVVNGNSTAEHHRDVVDNYVSTLTTFQTFISLGAKI